jgi:hypothetical protein
MPRLNPILRGAFDIAIGSGMMVRLPRGNALACASG